MTINCKGTLLDLSTPKIMGILNITNDSFYDGGKYLEEKKIIKRILQMQKEGIHIFDVGGQSTKPNAKILTKEEEWQSVEKALKILFKLIPDAIVSLDSFYAENIKKAHHLGISIANDISAGSLDKEMFPTIAELQIPYILMHMKGNPSNMQNAPIYDNIILEINTFFSEKTFALKSLGINDIILDPGFGFGKSISHNYQILNKLNIIGLNDFPLLAGISRKSMIYKPLDTTPQNALNGTSALHLKALEQGTKILRVHDIKEAKEVITLHQLLKQNETLY